MFPFIVHSQRQSPSFNLSFARLFCSNAHWPAFAGSNSWPKQAPFLFFRMNLWLLAFILFDVNSFPVCSQLWRSFWDVCPYQLEILKHWPHFSAKGKESVTHPPICSTPCWLSSWGLKYCVEGLFPFILYQFVIAGIYTCKGASKPSATPIDFQSVAFF